jgi:hypothetical protein
MIVTLVLLAYAELLLGLMVMQSSRMSDLRHENELLVILLRAATVTNADASDTDKPAHDTLLPETPVRLGDEA